MAGAVASAALLVAASLALGQAVLALCGWRRRTWSAGPIGLALLFVIAGLVAAWGGRGSAIAIVLSLLLVFAGSFLVLVGRGSGGPWRRLRSMDARTPADTDVKPPPTGAIRLAVPAAAACLAALFAALPFIAAGDVGILGVGLVNDDMASHLLLADWIDERFRPEPVLIDQGYPIGPHALVAGLSELLGARSIDVFAGLVLAIPALTALVAFAALDGVRTVTRVAASALVALPYMAAAYLAQEAFKEPIVALFLLAFALLLPTVQSARQAVALGLIAAGAVYVYSFPGLAWLAGTAIVWGAVAGIRGRRVTRVWPAVLAATAALVVFALPDIGRLADFADFRALDPDRANEGGLGNLRGQISPLEALGVWPTSEFRLSAAASSLPAVVFYAGALLAAAAFAAGLPRWLRRHGPAIPAALLTAALLYLAARAFGTVYTSAKALAIAAPLIALVTFGGLLAPGLASGRVGVRGHPGFSVSNTQNPGGGQRRLPTLLAVAFGLAAAASSFLILRQAPVAPERHMEELAEIRPLVEGEKLLFLGRDNFVLHSLRGSKPFTSVRNFYDPYYVKPNLELEQAFAKFDFDAVTAQTLARFPYVLATRAAYASGPPPGYRAIAETQSYVLWEQGRRSPLGREPGETDAEPGRLHGCDPRRSPAGPVATFRAVPILGSDWSRATVKDGEDATVELELPPGAWDLSLQYDSTRPLSLAATGFDSELPGNLDYRGTVPYFPAGRIEVERGGPTELTVVVEPPPLAGRLLGANSVAHLGSLAATRPGGSRTAPVPATACRGYVDWYVR